MSESDQEFGHEDHTASNQCGVTLMNNQDGYILAQMLKEKDNVQIRELPSMIRVDGTGTFEILFDEVSDAVGREFDQADFEEIMSTHYGRMVLQDDRVMFFANPEDAAEALGFDLEPVEQQ